MQRKFPLPDQFAIGMCRLKFCKHTKNIIFFCFDTKEITFDLLVHHPKPASDALWCCRCKIKRQRWHAAASAAVTDAACCVTLYRLSAETFQRHQHEKRDENCRDSLMRSSISDPDWLNQRPYLRNGWRICSSKANRAKIRIKSS